MIPLFDEMRPYLDECHELAEPGSQFVITRYRDATQNLRTQFMRIIRRAGLKPWPRLFQNLRASRETELAANHPLHHVCEWIGNSQPVAMKHYLSVRDEDYEQAARQWAQSPSVMGGTGEKSSGIEIEKTSVFPANTRPYGIVHKRTVGHAGLEPATSSL